MAHHKFLGEASLSWARLSAERACRHKFSTASGTPAVLFVDNKFPHFVDQLMNPTASSSCIGMNEAWESVAVRWNLRSLPIATFVVTWSIQHRSFRLGINFEYFHRDRAAA